MEAVAALALCVTFVAALLAIAMSRRAAEARRTVERLRQVDHLTGLPGRRHLRTWLDATAPRDPGDAGSLSLFLVELLRFETFDHTYGHETADALIAAAARSLQGEVRPNELLIRYQGPQFMIASTDIGDAAAVRDRAAQLLDAVQHRYEVEQVELGAVIGCVLSDQGHTDTDGLLVDAGTALRQAKAHGEGSISFYDPAMADASRTEIAAQRLRRALDAEEFTLVYLPVVELGPDFRLLGVEALLRWEDPDSGLVDAAEFLPTLESTGLIIEVGRWVLQEACAHGRTWQDHAPDGGTDITVNVSPHQLSHGDFVEQVKATITETGLDPACLSIEMTGNEAVGDLEVTARMLQELRAMGVGVTLDDFGAGRASLHHLRHLSADALKIDESFVRGLGESREDESLVQQVIGLAHALGMRVMAEGVETAKQVEILRSFGCDGAQGYYFSGPQPADVAARMLEKGHLDAKDRRELGRQPDEPAGPTTTFSWAG